MPKFFIAGIALFLLLSAGYGLTQAVRYIPWDCSDWQAFAHSDRDTAILESLAENRGKTLYCGIDQSDTFAKAETWEAGKDRNERDGTVYWGEGGSFRGFIAAQEGWLTDGESGITGQSIAVIFEFPREERRGRRIKRFAIASEGGCPDPDTSIQVGDRTPGTAICSDWGGYQTSVYGGESAAATYRDSKYQFVEDNRGDLPSPGGKNALWTVPWATFPGADYWQEKAVTTAKSACRARGGKSVSNVVFGQGHSRNQGSGTTDKDRGPGLGWFFRDNVAGSNVRFSARQSRTWTATCIKKGPRR